MKELDALLEHFDALVLLKVHPALDPLIEALTERSLLDQAVFVERVGTPEERILHDIASLRGTRVHDLSLILIRQDRRRGLGVAPS